MATILRPPVVVETNLVGSALGDSVVTLFFRERVLLVLSLAVDSLSRFPSCIGMQFGVISRALHVLKFLPHDHSQVPSFVVAKRKMCLLC